jgi:hypothetical protein
MTLRVEQLIDDPLHLGWLWPMEFIESSAALMFEPIRCQTYKIDEDK